MDAKKFNDLFINNVEQVVLNISTNDYALEYLNAMKRVNTAFAFRHVSVEEVYATNFELSNSLCFDVYQINSNIIKLAAMYICEPLVHIAYLTVA